MTDTAPNPAAYQAPDAGEIRRRYTRGAEATRGEQRAYWLNESFMRGEQWVYWDANRSVLEQVADDDRTHATIPKLRPYSRSIIAKLLRRPLVFDVTPTAADDKAVGASRKARSVLEDIHREHGWEEIRRQHAWATWKGGTGGLCVEWDPEAGDELLDPSDGTRFHTGDTVETALAVTEIVTMPGCRDIERAPWWIKATAMPPEEAKERFGLPEAPAADATGNMSPTMRELVAEQHGASRAEVNLCLVLTYFERPHGSSPGCVATVVGTRIVDGPHPWPFPFKDRLNLVVAREHPNHGTWTGDTVVSDAVFIQTAINQSWSSIIEHQTVAGNARLTAEEGSVDDDAFDDDPRSIVWTRPGTQNPPDYLSPPQMPQWWIEMPDRLKGELDDTLGYHDVSRGDAPSGVESGIGLTILAEQDDTPLGALSKELAETWGRFATLVLETLAAKVAATRESRLERPGQIPELVRWTGQDLAGQTTATVPLEAVSPRSRASQLQLAMTLWEQGILTDPKQFAAIADLPGQDDFTEGLDPDVAKARRENYRMSLGIPEVPATFDNHTEHIAEHNRMRKSGEYDRLDAETRRLVDLHVQAHEVLGAEEMGRQLAKSRVSPALAAAPDADEPPLAGDPGAVNAAGPAGPLPALGPGPAAPDGPPVPESGAYGPDDLPTAPVAG